MESDFCCVCGVRLKQQRHVVLEQRTNIISLLCELIAPRIVSENDSICQFCYKNIDQTSKDFKATKTQETNDGLDMEVFEDTEQSFNNKCSKTAQNNICLMCDTLLSTRQSLCILKQNPSELDQLMMNLISEAISPELIGSEDKVCSNCWFKVRRSAINLQHNNINELEPNVNCDEDQSVEIKSEPGSDQEHSEYLIQNEEIEVQHSELNKSVPEDVDDDSIEKINDNSEIIIKSPVNDKEHKNNYKYLSDLDPHINELQDDPNDPDFIARSDIKKKIHKQLDKQTEKGNTPLVPIEIMLPSYKRAPRQSGKCVFPKCRIQQTKTISKELRVKMIKHYKFYIPSKVRVCIEHFSSNSYNTLPESNMSSLKFNASHIEDMFSMVREKNNIEIDFSDVLNLDESIINHLLGTTRDILTTILTKEPQILKKTNGLLGLIALFIKRKNGSSTLRISDFLKLPRKTLFAAMKSVQETLSKSLVTKELGLEDIL